mgnify:CR=1 FL=1
MSAPRIRVVLVSHGEQSKGMLNTVQMLLGPQENIAAYGLYPDSTVDALADQLRAEVEQYGAENIVFFSELRQGSPFNALVSLTRDYDIYHITGTNLAMLMAVIIERDDEDISAEELCEAAMEAVEGSMLNVRQFLKEQIEDCDEEEDL